jgi:hypothetical protein
MLATIEIDDQTFSTLNFAARMAGVSIGEVVARLVSQAGSPPATLPELGAKVVSAPTGVKVYADYDGIRTYGTYNPITTRIDITSGPLAGRGFKTPTGAARAVVSQYKPGVSPNRNGWSFWTEDGSGAPLQTLRHAL